MSGKSCIELNHFSSLFSSYQCGATVALRVLLLLGQGDIMSCPAVCGESRRNSFILVNFKNKKCVFADVCFDAGCLGTISASLL